MDHSQNQHFSAFIQDEEVGWGRNGILRLYKSGLDFIAVLRCIVVKVNMKGEIILIVAVSLFQ